MVGDHSRALRSNTPQPLHVESTHRPKFCYAPSCGGTMRIQSNTDRVKIPQSSDGVKDSEMHRAEVDGGEERMRWGGGGRRGDRRKGEGREGGGREEGIDVSTYVMVCS